MDLNALRDEIDSIDGEMVRLLDRRAEIALEVGKSKADTNVATFDAGRARNVVIKAVERSTGSFPREGLVHVFREVISACLNLQKALRVGFLGPRDTFTHQAAVREFGSSVELSAYRIVRDVFAAVVNGTVDYGVVPIENSTGGTVHTTLDAFIEYPVNIASEVLLPIHHVLLSKAEQGKIQRVYSHPLAFLQCEQWLRRNLPEVKRIDTDSTAQGMQMAAEDTAGAAIGSEHGAEEYGLDIVARSIQDDKDNTTRFLVISKMEMRTATANKTSIMFSVKDRPGALFNVLKPFKDNAINLSKLESRPTKRRAWEQAFFVDADSPSDDPKLLSALDEIGEHCDSVRVLGSYARDRTPSELESLQRDAQPDA